MASDVLSFFRRLFLMLQRFPVESKGRRKKLQEVHFVSVRLKTFRGFIYIMCYCMPVYCNAGWLCDYNLLFLLLDQMRHGKRLHVLCTSLCYQFILVLGR